MTVTTPPLDDRALRAAVHARLAQRADITDLDPGAPLVAELAALVHAEAPFLARPAVDRIVAQLTDEVRGLGPLEPVLADPDVCEVMINGPGRAFVERRGRIEPLAVDLAADDIVRMVERVIAPLGLRLDRAAPIVDARLPDGSRLHAIIPPLALDGPCVTIRRFGTRLLTVGDFCVPGAAAAFLTWAVRAGANILVTGGTGSGKTTFLNALSASLPAGDRIVTIEETAELQLRQPHVVRLEARPPNAEGTGAVSVRELVRSALRMRPDRIVVGEVRGGEALDLLAAMNTGHDGSLCTLHANRPADAITRLETLVLLAASGLPLDAVRTQIGATIDLVVHVHRTRDGHRAVAEIAEVVPAPSPWCRALFAGPELRALAVPQRAARRHDAPPLEPEWFGC